MLIALAVAAACSAGEPTGPAQSGTDVADLPIALAPRQVTLEAGQTALFRAYERGASVADSLVTSVEWTATGGTIQSDGVYSSGATGAFRVVGKKLGQAKQVGDTANIIVVPSQPNVTSVVVTPGAASVPAGGQQSFTAVGKLSDGTTVPIGVEWTTTGGTIDAGGTFTAGTAVGTYRVVAKAASANVADTVSITVSALASSPPPSSSDHPNEPSGMTLMTSRPFNAMNELGWDDNAYPFSGIVTQPDRPGTVGQWFFRAGTGTTTLAGNAPGAAFFSTSKRDRQMYNSVWFKVSSNWYAHPNETKLTFNRRADYNDIPVQTVYTAIYPTSSDMNGPIQLGLGIQGCLNYGGAEIWRSGVTLTRGTWHHLETLNDAGTGAADGWIKVWIDGRLAVSATGIQWPGAPPAWQGVSIVPTWGGGPANIPADQFIWFDDDYASGM